MISKPISLMCLFLLLCSVAVYADDPWTFVSWPDPHWEIADLSGSHPTGTAAAPGYPGSTSGYNGITAEMQAMMDGMIAQMAAHNPEAVLIAGDMGGYRWDNSNFLNVMAPGGTYADAVALGGDIYWTQLRYWFTSGGIPNVLVAVGDHELGDNDWAAGSTISWLVDDFRTAFAGAFTQDNTGASIYTQQIGGVDTRPIGTAYSETSNAYQINNVLFVTLDVFRQDHANTQLHSKFGSILPDIEGAHLTWVDNLLTAAQADPTIDHIITQCHTPILGPVRKFHSSGMMFHERGDSDLWNTFRQYSKVRVHFAGEVHYDTASKDTNSDILQIVHGRNGYLLGTVYPDRIEFETYDFQTSVSSDPKYWQNGSIKNGGGSVNGPPVWAGALTADYSGPSAAFTGSGTFELMDQKGLLIHYSFDETDTSLAPNTGSMGSAIYGCNKTGMTVQNDGKIKNAAGFNGSASMATKEGISPVTESEARTAAAWVRTTNTGKITIAGWGGNANGGSGKFNMDLDGGIFGLSSEDTQTRAAGATSIADGNWHHVASVVPGRDQSKISEMKFYIDGVEYSSSSTSTNKIFTNGSVNLLYVGKAAKNSTPFFNGDIDDFAIWGSALTHAKIRTLFTAANHSSLEYNAAQMESLFDLFDAGQGQADVAGTRWNIAAGLVGQVGDVVQIDPEHFAIILDQSGNGVKQVPINEPLIVEQPTSQLVRVGKTVSFSVTVNGAAPLSYQWYKTTDHANDTPGDDILVGSTSSLQLTVNDSTVGFYFCNIGNSYGNTTSDVVSLEQIKMLAHWKLDNDAANFNGTHYLDISTEDPVAHDALITGTPSFVTGLDGDAVDIDDNNGYANSGSWNPAEDYNQMTLALWAKWHQNDGQWRVLISKKNTSTTELWRLSINPSGSLLNFAASSGNRVELQMPVNEWVFIAVTLNGNYAQLYMKQQANPGFDIDSGTVALGPDPTAPFWLGTATTSNPFNGILDDVRVFDHVLTYSEIAEVYADVSGEGLCADIGSLQFDVAGPDGDGPDCIVDFYDFAKLAESWLECILLPTQACP